MKYPISSFTPRELTDEIYRCLWRGRAEGAMLACLVVVVIWLIVERRNGTDAPPLKTPTMQQRTRPILPPDAEEDTEVFDSRTRSSN